RTQKWLEAKAVAESSGETSSFTAKKPTFQKQALSMIKESLRGWIFSAEELMDLEVVEDLEDLDTWKVMDLYMGLVLKKLGEIWVKTFRMSKTVRSYLAGKFVQSLEDFSHSEIW
ncbi:hypothetical protein BG006_002993, partial [Podila minutissima]